jgi:hypothetical protein
MKTIKVALATLVLSAIAFFVIKSIFIEPPVEGGKSTSGNPFIDKIQQEIKSITLKPDNNFCKESYSIAFFQINDFHKSRRFGNSTSENDLWKENLTKQLYAAYAQKFIKQAFYIFNRREWNNNDLNFIRDEYLALQKSNLLERNSLIDKKFNEIKSIFYKYDEIVSFISACNEFSYTEINLDLSFPIQNITNKISVAKKYRSNNLENTYVNNCSRLHIDLKKVPKNLFYVHVKYLDNIIDFWSNSYKNFINQSSHKSSILFPIKEKIEILDMNKDIYDVPELENEQSRLEKKLEKDGNKAMDYFKQKKENQ